MAICLPQVRAGLQKQWLNQIIQPYYLPAARRTGEKLCRKHVTAGWSTVWEEGPAPA